MQPPSGDKGRIASLGTRILANLLLLMDHLPCGPEHRKTPCIPVVLHIHDGQREQVRDWTIGPLIHSSTQLWWDPEHTRQHLFVKRLSADRKTFMLCLMLCYDCVTHEQAIV